MSLVFNGLILLVPSFLEYILYIYECEGNMALFGIFTDIYNKRNLIYISTFLLIIFYLINLTMVGVILEIIAIILYCRTIYKWSKTVDKHLRTTEKIENNT